MNSAKVEELTFTNNETPVSEKTNLNNASEFGSVKPTLDFNQGGNSPVDESPASHYKTLRETVTLSLESYFSHLDDQKATNIYNMVIGEVEPSLFAAVLKHTKGNQTKAAAVLGVNRGTLRKKLKQYNIS